MGHQIIWPKIQGKLRGDLPAITQGSTLETLTIGAFYSDGTGVSLTGKTITATATDEAGNTTSITGTLTGGASQFTWALSEGDIGTDGTYTLIVTYTDGVKSWASDPARFTVLPNPAADSVQNPSLYGVSGAAAAWATVGAAGGELGDAAYEDADAFDAAGSAAARVAKAGDTMTGVLVMAPEAEPAIWFEYDPNYSEAKKWFFRFGTPTTNAGDANRKDHPLKWGYNVGPDGQRDDIADANFYLQMEDYYAPTTDRLFEYHLNYTSSDGAFSARPFHINVYRDISGITPNTFTHEYRGRQFTFAGMAGYNAMQIVAGTDLANSTITFLGITAYRGDSTSLILVRNAANNRTYFTADTTNEKMKFSLFTDTGFQLVNSGDAQLFAFSSDGKMTIGAGGKFAHLYIYNTTDDEALLLRPLAAQTKPLFEIWNKSAAASFRIDWEGIIDFRGTMGDSAKTVGTDAPADWVEIKINGTARYIPAYAAT